MLDNILLIKYKKNPMLHMRAKERNILIAVDDNSKNFSRFIRVQHVQNRIRDRFSNFRNPDCLHSLFNGSLVSGVNVYMEINHVRGDVGPKSKVRWEDTSMMGKLRILILNFDNGG